MIFFKYFLILETSGCLLYMSPSFKGGKYTNLEDDLAIFFIKVANSITVTTSSLPTFTTYVSIDPKFYPEFTHA